MELKVNFFYQNNSFQIQCSSNDEMVEVLGKFKSKLNPASSIHDYEYYYQGKEFSYESTIAKNLKLNSNNKEITISVKRRVRICKCPNCKCNDCIINLSNYQCAFYGCKYDKNKEHEVITVYDNYKNFQNINYSEIRCHTNGCEKNLENEQYDFYKCLTCSKRDKIGKYFCYECKLKHKNTHILVKYDEKNYYCGEHFEAYEKCCLTCTKDLCKGCEDEHAGHEIASYTEMTTSVQDLRATLKTIKENIDTLEEVIENIKYNLDGTKRIYKRYYNISLDIIRKFETFNKTTKNYRILRTVRNLKFSNKQMLESLEKIINEKELQNKCSIIIETYLSKENLYKGVINKSIKIIETESDANWYEEIQKVKKNKMEKELEKEKDSEKKRAIKNTQKKK